MVGPQERICMRLCRVKGIQAGREWLNYITDRQEVSLKEHVTWNTNKSAHSGFETQRRHHQKSKTGISGLTKMSSENENKQMSELSALVSGQCHLISHLDLAYWKFRRVLSQA